MTHFRRGNVDLRMGSSCWSAAFSAPCLASGSSGLRRLGQIDLSIRLAYVLFLGPIGVLMLIECAARRIPAGADDTACASRIGIFACTACRSRSGFSARSSTSAP